MLDFEAACEFGCGRPAHEPRVYKWGRQEKLVRSCEECDARARSQLAREESRLWLGRSSLDNEAVMPPPPPKGAASAYRKSRAGQSKGVPGGGRKFGRDRGTPET